MAKRKLILLIAAFGVALITMLVVRTLMTPQTKMEAVTPVEVTQILAAAHDLPVGTILKENDMKWIPWAVGGDTSSFYMKGKDDMARLNGAILRDGLRSGEPLMVGRVVQPRDHGFLAAILAPGKRAMAITLSPGSQVAGFIFPGDHVDVILTHSFSRKDVSDLTERRVSETVLTDVRVLALDQKSDTMSADPKIAQLATLEVTPKQAEKLALAADLAGSQNSASHGTLSLTLRSLASDDNGAETPESKSEAPMTADGNIALPVPADQLSPQGTGNPQMTPSPQAGTTTWDSEVSPAFPAVGGTSDSLMQRVHIMRGKDATDANFERRQ